LIENTLQAASDSYIPQAEFSYKVKPKVPQQFKWAETAGVPFAVILGEDELAQGKVRIKEMGLPESHPEKEGVLVDLKALPEEVKTRLAKKKCAAAGIEKQVEGLTVQEKEAPKTEDAGV
jgi:histidyl-tRNA synthetase